MTEETPGQQAEENTFKPIASQEELNKLIGARIGAVKAQYADYDDLKAKAAKFDDVEAASKSELQKAQEAAKAAEERATRAEQAALRADVAVAKGVPPTALAGATRDELEKSADDLLAWRGERKTTTRPTVLKSGSSSEDVKPGKAGAAAALRAWRQGGDD